MSVQTKPCDYCGELPCPYWDLALHPKVEVQPGTCEHKDFAAGVTVNRLTDTGRFSADVRIQCSECKEPFRFLGVRAGSSPYEPRASIDGLELRAPIEPHGTPALQSHAEFVMPPLPTKKES